MHDLHGIDDAALRCLVALFYDRVRADPALGPIFEDAIHDWPAHLETLTAFWSSVMCDWCFWCAAIGLPL